MKFKTLILNWYSDLHRYEESMKVNLWKVFYRRYMIAGFHYMFWLRLCQYLLSKGKYMLPLYILAAYRLQRLKYKYGISISPPTNIGKGFYIGHFGDIVINKNVNIGDNCSISHGVTLGANNRGKRKGVPSIGNNVYIGAGAKIIGNVSIGDFACIGANALVVDDVPKYGVAVGNPANVISLGGSDGYIGFPFPVKTYMERLGLEATEDYKKRFLAERL